VVAEILTFRQNDTGKVAAEILPAAGWQGERAARHGEQR